MFVWVHRRLREEEGISLVEMLVSILLLGLVLSALGNVLLTSMASARQGEGTTGGSAIAGEALENLHAVPWAALGFYTSDVGYTATATVGGQVLNTVALGSTRPAAAAAPKPTYTKTVDNKVYTVTQRVVWKTLNRYKWMRVRVTWNDGATARQVVLEARRARKPSDSGAGTAQQEPFRIRTFTVAPDPVMLNPMGRLDASDSPVLEGNAALVIEIATSRAAAPGSVIVTYEPAKSVVLTEVPDTQGLQWRALVPPDSTSVYFTKLVTFTGNAKELGTNLAAPADTTVAMFLRKFVSPAATTSYILDNSTRALTYTASPTASSADRVCVAQSGNAANAKPLTADTSFYFSIGGLEAPDAAAVTPGDTVTLTRKDPNAPAYVLTLAHFVYNGTEYWRGTLPASGNGRPTFFQDTITRWELAGSRTYDGKTWAPIPVALYVTATNQTC